MAKFLNPYAIALYHVWEKRETLSTTLNPTDSPYNRLNVRYYNCWGIPASWFIDDDFLHAYIVLPRKNVDLQRTTGLTRYRRRLLAVTSTQKDIVVEIGVLPEFSNQARNASLRHVKYPRTMEHKPRTREICITDKPNGAPIQFHDKEGHCVYSIVLNEHMLVPMLEATLTSKMKSLFIEPFPIPYLEKSTQVVSFLPDRITTNESAIKAYTRRRMFLFPAMWDSLVRNRGVTHYTMFTPKINCGLRNYYNCFGLEIPSNVLHIDLEVERSLRAKALAEEVVNHVQETEFVE